MKYQTFLKKCVAPLLNSGTMTADPAEQSIETLIEMWAALYYSKDRIEKRLKALRTELLERAEVDGEPTDRGGNKLSVDGSLVLRERRVASLPDEKVIRTLLEQHDLKPADGFSKVTKVVLDASKIENLVALGKLPEKKVEAAKKTTYALRVKESYDLADMLEALIDTPLQETIKKPAKKRFAATGKRKGA